MRRNLYSNGKYNLNPVNDFRIFAGFSCCAPDDEDKDLDDFIQNDALKIDLANYPYKSSPSVKVGRLGVSNEWQGGGIGTELLTMIKDFMLTDNRTGCKYITVDAYNKPRVLRFYAKNGFALLKSPNPQRKQEPMYFDLLSHHIA